MAHNLATNADGSASMFYCGESPWHGLGTYLDRPATSQQAMAAAGLDYDVTLETLFTSAGVEITQGKGVIRSDNKVSLGVVGNRFAPVQNREAFSFLDNLVGADQISYHTAGALGLGERVWLLAKLGDEIRVNGSDDAIGKFLLLSNSHDGRTSLRCFFTPIRVVCQNTLVMASRMAKRQGVVIRHTGNLVDKLAQARETLGLAESYYASLQGQIDGMARKSLNKTLVLEYFASVFPAPADAEKSKRAAENAKQTTESLLDLWERGKGNDTKATRHTLWTAYNAVTEYVDHHQENNRDAKRSLEDQKSTRLDRIWFGDGADVKGTAFESAVNMLKGQFETAPKARKRATVPA